MMTSKEKALYKKVFGYLESTYKLKPENVMMDYESASRQAIGEIFSEARIRGCHFHFNQSLDRKANQCEDLDVKNPQAKVILDMFMSLPLLPLENIREGFEIIKQYQVQLELQDDFDEFNLYFENFWLSRVTKEGFCVSDLVFRTNNFNEGYNSKLKRVMERKMNVYEFLQAIIELMEEAINKFRYAKAKNVVFKSTSKITPQLDKALLKLENGSYTILDFLLDIKDYKKKTTDKNSK